MSKMLLTITGASGCGKTSIMRELQKTYGVSRVITCTTREPRPGEKDGVDYHFCQSGKWSYGIGKTEFAGNRYWIALNELFAQFKDNDVLAIIVDRKGAEELADAFLDDNYVEVHNIFININPKRALSFMSRRDGWSKAKKRQKADFEAGLYFDKYFEAARIFDCIISNDKSNSIKNMARDIMNYVEAQKWAAKIGGAA